MNRFMHTIIYMFCLCMVGENQYNFRINFQQIYTYGGWKVKDCPKFHVWVAGIYPYSCVSYRNECLGVSQVELRYAEGQPILCHPNFQPDLTTNFQIKNNFSVDPTQSITLQIDDNDPTKLRYTKDILLPNCYIVYAYKNSQNVRTSHCLFSQGDPTFNVFNSFDVMFQYQYGMKLTNETQYPSFTSCSNSLCQTCDKDDVCITCYGDNYTTSTDKTCELKCPLPGGKCVEQNQQPTECRDGYVKVGSSSFTCQYCRTGCQTCTADYQCTKCSTMVGQQDSRPIPYKYNFFPSLGFCDYREGCIEYNLTNTYCIKCNIGYKTNGGECKVCDAFCFHCIEGQQECLICKQGFYKVNGVCEHLGDFACSKSCQTCLLSNSSHCTTCPLGYYAKDGSCYCDEMQKYYDVDTDCKACNQGICQTCITFYECLTCKPETFRYLDGSQCVCLDGYYEAGNIQYICQKCHPVCQTCFGGDISSCVTCYDSQNRNFIKGMCICAQGYGENKNNLADYVCGSCYSRCSTCEFANDPQSCTSCLEDQNRQLAVTTECVCIDTYGDNYGEYDVCFICHYSCQNCDGPTENDCTSCTDSSHRFLNQDFQCKCSKGYFDNDLLECSSCHYSCTDCQNDPNKDQCTECPSSREPDVLESVFKCICKDSNYFDDGLNRECQQCHYTCLTCSFYGPSFCKSCDLSIRKLKSSHCICNEKTFDDDILATCLPCHSSCLTCQGTESTDCLTCQSDIELRELLGGACVCQEGYFEENNAQICSKCSPKCKTCAVSKDLCLTCPLNSFRELGDDYSCSCPLGFFDDPATFTCILCHLKCLTCFGIGENDCLTCKPLANRYLKDGQCLCNTHYYEANVEQCSICSQDCLDCSEQFDHCTSCKFGKKLVGNTCQCGTKLEGLVVSTFKMFGEPECQKCHYSCLSCQGSTFNKCVDCYEIENRYLNAQKCLCSNGYYDSGVPQCQKCGYQCQTCIDTENSCLSCQQNSLRMLNTQTFSCACNSGYFDDGANPICQKCDYKCGQCSIRFDHCITCESNTYRQFNDIFFTCDCISGFYDGGDAKCKPCHYSCLECTGSGNSNCKSCNIVNSLAKRALFYTQCICQVGFYDDGFSSNCQPCDTTCVECKNQAYSCITCSTTRTLKGNVCKCKSGYLETGQKDCTLCDKNCLECKYTNKTCTDCDSNLFRALDSATKSCICEIGFLEIDGQCQKCNTSCLTCSIAYDNCTSCLANRLFKNNQCLCQDGFFESQGVCQNCHKSCLTCQNTESFCLTCSIQNYRKLTISNACICIDSYYEQQTTLSCEKCDYSCKTCSVTAQNCTSCDSTLNLDIYFNKCLCEKGYYLDSATSKCLQCHISCLTCDLYSKCTSCRTQTRRFNDGLYTCDCKEGYFETNQADCLQCNLNCLTCTISKNNCQSCDPVYLRKLVGNQCICPSGYYDAGIQLCQPCGAKCKTCVDKWSKCTLCYQTEQHRFLNVNTCECQSGYFDSGQDICQKCSIKCKTCVGLNDYCTSCDIDQRRLDYSVIHKCPCIQGFYEDESGECQKCHIKCDGCMNTRESCLNCNNPLKSNRYLLSNQCNCKPGFYDDNIQLECQKCSKICETCITSATNCLQCLGNLRHNPPYCNCLDGYYEDASQNCLQCQNQCQTCVQTENNCLTCKHGRINQNCECPKGYFEAGQIDCIKCEFQCSECFQYSTQCSVCRGNRINPHTCICEDGYYDDGVNNDCQECDFRCKTCNISGCLTCDGNRILSNEQTCDPPQNSISYETTPWCSNCEVAVLLIRFSDDLNSISIKFDFKLKPIQEVKQCNQILEDETLNLIGFGYSCNLNNQDKSILIISLGEESKIKAGDPINLNQNILQHEECQLKLQTFIFNVVQVPVNILEPLLSFEVPNYSISSCMENIISTNQIDRNGKRSFSQIQWSYKIINSENRQELDDLIQSLNANQELVVVIPAQTLPENAAITFSIQITNFLGTSSQTSFDLHTLSSFQPIIMVDTKSTYFNYQTITINYNVKLLNCNNKNTVYNPNYQINLVETSKSNITAASSNINQSFKSGESQYSLQIAKFQLTPKTIYNFKINATELQTQQSSEIFFKFEIKPADLLCQFNNLSNVQDFRKDLQFYIQCKDSNANYDWNQDSNLDIEVSCIDLFTQDDCINQNKQKLITSQHSFEQKVPRYSVKVYTVQSWKVFAQKEDQNKTFEQIIVFLDDSFESLQFDHNLAYKIRPVNNFEQLNFTYQVPINKKADVVEMSLSIICDFSIIKILQPKFYQFQMQLQNYIKETLNDINQYNFKFSVQFSTNINPSVYNLPLTLNIPPICSKFKQTQSNFQGVKSLDIVTYCAKSDDSPYLYKVGYFLTEADQIDYQNGNSKSIYGSQLYQKSPRLNIIIPQSFLNNSVQIIISVMDQGGSITNLYGNTEVQKQFNCTQQNITQPSEFGINVLIANMFQALGQEGSKCITLRSYYHEQLLSLSNLSQDDLVFQMKAIKVYQNYSKYQKQQLRLLLDEKPFKSCIDSGTNNFIINYSPYNNSLENSTQSLEQLQQDNQKFEQIVNFLIKLYNQFNSQFVDQGMIWDQNLFDQQEEIVQSLKYSLLIVDKLLVELQVFNELNEQLYQIYKSLLLQIDQITKPIQERLQVNGNPEQQEGDMMTWKLQRLTRQKFNSVFGNPSSLDDEIIIYTQKEQLELKLNPLIFSNSTILKMQGLINSSYILLDPSKIIHNSLKNFRSNGQFLVQQKLNEKFSYQMSSIGNCSNDSLTAQSKNYSASCYVMSDIEVIEQCGIEVNYQNQLKDLQNQQLTVNCICSSFGSIFIAYKLIENESVLSNKTDQVANFQNSLSFDYRKVNFLSPLIIIYFSYVIAVIILQAILVFQNRSKSDLDDVETDILKEQIKIYPGNFAILKQNIKFIHQLLSPFYFKDSIISKSFYFIDFNLQFNIMLLSPFLLIVNLGPYQSYIEMIVVALIGMIFRLISRILQGFYRLNKVFNILIVTVELVLFLGAGFAIIILMANSTSEKNLQKLFDFFIGFIIYEGLNEPILIFGSIIGYKITFESIRNKEFQVLNHLIYYFVYHQHLEVVFQKYVIF